MKRVEEIVRTIRRDLEEAERKNPDSARPRSGRFEPLRGSPALSGINRDVTARPGVEIRSHRRWLGPLIVAGKRVVRALLLTALRPELERERETIRRLVSFSNESAARADELAQEIESAMRSIGERLDNIEAALARLGDIQESLARFPERES